MSANDSPQPAPEAPEAVPEPEVAPAHEAVPTPDARPAPRPGRWKRLFWPALCFLQLAVFSGWYYLGPRPAPHKPKGEDSAEEQEHPPEAESAEQPLTPIPPFGDMDRADELFRSGRYDLALAIYQPLSAGAVAPLRDTLNYRIGLCLEGLGRWEHALAAYRNVAGRSTSAEAVAVAQLGQARVWLQQRKPAEAAALLYPLLLRSGHPTLRDLPFLADARYLLALALTQDAVQLEAPGPLNKAVVGHTATDWTLETALNWPYLSRGREANALLEPGADIIQVRVTTGQEEPLARVAVKKTSAAELLDRLAEQAKLKVEWSAAARELVEGRVTPVFVENVPLAGVVRDLAGTLDLVATLTPGSLRLQSRQEVPGEEFQRLRQAMARRALREAMLEAPEHALTPAARLEMGNLEMSSGRPREAILYYERLNRDSPRSPVAVEGNYNLGLALELLEDRPAARTAFYRVVDKAPGHDLTPLAYYRVGRMHLDDGDGEDAITALRRSMGTTRTSSTRPAAVLSLAAAYLLVGNPRAANTLLWENRAILLRETYRPDATFLDSLARYRAAPEKRLADRMAAELLTSLVAYPEDPVLGLTGTYLAGQGYRSLGLHERMTALYVRALKAGAKGPLATEMTYAAAEALYAAEKHAEAIPYYEQLTSGLTWAAPARLRLAEIALLQGDPKRCLQWCQKALQAGAGGDAKVLLKLMGSAYEMAGDHRQAARCFAGQWPQ